jgi:hypothetical protein
MQMSGDLGQIVNEQKRDSVIYFEEVQEGVGLSGGISGSSLGEALRSTLNDLLPRLDNLLGNAKGKVMINLQKM